MVIRIGCLTVLAFAVCMAAYAQEPPDAPSLERARALHAAGRTAEAKRDLEALVRAGTEDPQVFLLLGVVERTDDDLGGAITSLQRAQALAPDAVPVAVELATTLAWNRNLDRAIVLFRQVLTAEPDNVGARSGLGFALAWQGELDAARTIFMALTEDAPGNVAAWSGLGFVERAALHTDAAGAAYRRVLELDPGNGEANAAIEALRWDRRGETRILSGFGANPGLSNRGEGRVEIIYAMAPRLTLTGGYQRYAFGAVSPVTGGGVRVNTRREDSLEAGAIYRPSARTALAVSLYTFSSDEVKRGIVWIEGVVALTSRVSLIGNLRPAFSSGEPAWLWAGAGGAAVSLPRQQQLTARLLIGSDTAYEPRLTWLANYEAVLSRRFKVRLAVAHSSIDDRFDFTSLSAGTIYLLGPSFGLSVEASHRMGTAERSTVMAGVVLRH